MKIVHVIESSATGTLSIVTMAAQYQADKHDVTVIFSRRPDTPPNIETLFPSNVTLVEVGMSPKHFPWSLLALRSELKKIQPDVIHCHSSFGGFVGRLSSVFMRSRVFYSPHCISFMRKDISPLKNFLFKAFESVACLRPATYIACSESERSAIKNALSFVDVALLENAVDLSEFKALPNPHNAPGKKTVLTVGGIRPQKGFMEFAKIARECAELDLHFVWIGDGAVQDREVLEQAGVEVTGWKSRQEVIALLNDADLYLSTSLWEGMPVSVIEASAAGLPLLLRDCAGNSDIVVDKRGGCLFTQTSEAIELLSQFIADPDKFRQATLPDRKAVFQRFSVERFARHLEEIYQI
ncbi:MULTISPECIES: glycosyltransferase [Vibrio]|uniref:Glycosyltransferase n=2 Tax=Vibrio TaxID=662 RepID=A0A7X4LQ59_9VIBR|nr:MULTISPECIES: glycosyltransferase [Vibrio]MBF9001191.1 glycosyltransferase [Vibrio nitrifigilis]MZI95951.1 glycosyltransferase [Vibrio eleionomae]